jgi:hypothetical protein
MTQYEFTPEQNKVIGHVALRCVVNAVLLALLGLVGLIGAIMSLGDATLLISIIGMLYGVVFIIMGVMFFRPADNFRRVTTTEGNDITEIMAGLKELRGGFKLVSSLIIALLILDVITIVFFTA